MLPRIKSVIPIEKMKIQVVFQNNEEKFYDISQLCTRFPQFRQLEVETDLYKQAKVDTGGLGISWNDDLDLASEEIWEYGTSKKRE